MKKGLPLFLALALGTCATLSAQPPRPGPPPLELPRNLDLTEAQRQSIQAILERHRDAHMAKQKALEAQEKALMDAMTDPEIPESRLRELHVAASEARFSLLLEGRATMREIQAVLTPAQQAKAREQHSKFQRVMGCEQVPGEEPGPPPRP